MSVILAAVLTFTIAAAPTVVESGRGFDWTASGLGAAAGFGLALALVGSIALVRGRRDEPPSPTRGGKR